MSASADDGYETDNSSWTDNASTMKIGQDDVTSDDYDIGIRFQNLTIPPSSLINFSQKAGCVARVIPATPFANGPLSDGAVTVGGKPFICSSSHFKVSSTTFLNSGLNTALRTIAAPIPKRKAQNLKWLSCLRLWLV